MKTGALWLVSSGPEVLFSHYAHFGWVIFVHLMKRTSLLAKFGLGALASVALGCGAGDGPQLVPITGVVLIDSKPLTTGTLVTTVENGQGARGALTNDGQFELETPGVGKGAVPGKHFVAVVAYEMVDPGNLESEQKPLVPDKYLSAFGSGLVIDVREGREEPVRIELKSR